MHLRRLARCLGLESSYMISVSTMWRLEQLVLRQLMLQLHFPHLPLLVLQLLPQHHMVSLLDHHLVGARELTRKERLETRARNQTSMCVRNHSLVFTSDVAESAHM